MKGALLYLINKTFKSELELLYGKGSYIEINHILFSTNKKIHSISCKLFIGDVKLYEEAGESGLNYIFEQAWRYIGNHNLNFLLTISFELT
jgi:hypothetical protein